MKKKKKANKNTHYNINSATNKQGKSNSELPIKIQDFTHIIQSKFNKLRSLHFNLHDCARENPSTN